MATDTDISYAFAFDPWFERVAWPLRVNPHSTGVALDEERLHVEFGPWRITTPIENLLDATVTGPYAWPKVIGPPHLSLADGGLTFATNRDAGVCVRFVEPVRGSTPLPYPRHGSITITVEDPESLAEAIDAVMAAPDQPLTDLTEDLELDLSGATASELRHRARQLGVQGTSRMSKGDLVDALRPHAPGVDATS